MEKGQDVSTLRFMYDHLTTNFPVPKVDLTGRTAIVTGGNAGLGYETVLHFARSNASRIIIASRSIPKCQAAAEKVYKDVPGFRGKVEVMQLDLANFQSVIAFTKQVKTELDRVDFLVANAGVIKMQFKQTGDGYEETLQVNGLATGLMALLLLPKLASTADLPVPTASSSIKPTLSVVASEVHYWAKFAQQNATGPVIDALNDPAQFDNGSERYNISKVLSVFIGRELAKLPAVTSGKVIANSVNPGLCASGFRDDFGAIAAYLINLISWSAEFGARNFLYAATQNTKPGAFISHCQDTPPSTFVVSPSGKATQGKYWKESLALYRELAPEVSEAL